MPENVVLKFDADDSVEPFIVPVPDGSTAEAVVAAWPRWSLVEGADAGEVAADLAAKHAAVADQAAVEQAAADVPAPQPVAAPSVPAEPATPDAPSGDVTTPEGN